jgi:hypothetical protein
MSDMGWISKRRPDWANRTRQAFKKPAAIDGRRLERRRLVILPMNVSKHGAADHAARHCNKACSNAARVIRRRAVCDKDNAQGDKGKTGETV